MKTVGDFKKAGLVFVNGDEGSSFFVVNPKAMNERSFNDGDDVESFAWRENTGRKPEFSGLVEYETCDGFYNSGHTDCVNFSVRIGGKTVIKKWRPSLDQSEQNVPDNETVKSDDKPIFTQEMAEPPIGFKLKFNHDIDGKFNRLHDEKYGWEDGDDLEVIHITVNHDEDVCYIVLNCQPDVLTTAVITDLSFFDTRTPKQKAVDEMFEYAEVRGSKAAFERLYDAGYRKPE